MCRVINPVAPVILGSQYFCDKMPKKNAVSVKVAIYIQIRMQDNYLDIKEINIYLNKRLNETISIVIK